MELSQQVLSDLIIWMKYAQHREDLKRRETWEEIVLRNAQMHISRYPHLEEEIWRVYGKYVLSKKVLPSMRSMQFAGDSINLNPARMFNCSYLPVDSPEAFSETMFLLLSGTGVGYSVQQHHVNNLPPLRGPIQQGRRRRFLIGDSIEGWADAIKVLLESWFEGNREINFDYRTIRPKGSLIRTSGGKAPGPEPLRNAISHVTGILERAFSERGSGTKLTSLEAHDIMCHIADAVLAGGIRRSAMIALFDFTDQQMLYSKSGSWWELNPQRARANNSAVALRHRITKEDFESFWSIVENNKTGEPGIYFTNDRDWGTNPCVEIALKPFQFCNLTEINAGDIESQEDFNERARAAAFIGTLQAGYTNFHYLRPVWQETTEQDALLGVSMTGILSGKINTLNIEQASMIAASENERVSKEIGINLASRVTAVKPAGTTSLVLGTSSGIHPWHSYSYIRRIRVNKEEPIYPYLLEKMPSLLEDDVFKPSTQAVLSIPQEAPHGAKTRHNINEIQLLEMAKNIQTRWVWPGHRKGHNTNNVSITVNIREDKWSSVGTWMWENREFYNGIAVLPYDGGDYPQMPFEGVYPHEAERLKEHLSALDLSEIGEAEDNTSLQYELACSGGACEVI
jgi:ribonucleoside-diphosphate reductase alpha chain